MVKAWLYLARAEAPLAHLAEQVGGCWRVRGSEDEKLFEHLDSGWVHVEHSCQCDESEMNRVLQLVGIKPVFSLRVEAEEISALKRFAHEVRCMADAWMIEDAKQAPLCEQAEETIDELEEYDSW